MKKGINFGVIVSMFVACCVLLCSCANVGHNQAESAQLDLSRLTYTQISLRANTTHIMKVHFSYHHLKAVLR